MTTKVEQLAAEIQPPRQGEVIALASTTTTAFFDLQQVVVDYQSIRRTPYCNRFLTLEAEGGDVYIAVTRAATVAENLDPGVTGTTPAVTMGIRIAAGTSKTFWADGPTGDFRYLAHRTGTGTGTLRLWPSSKPELPR